MDKTEWSADAAGLKQGAVWIPCDDCEEFYCTIHEKHVCDCDCPEIDEWGFSPYEEQPVDYYDKTRYQCRMERLK